MLLVALGATAPGDGLVAGVQALRRGGANVQLVSRVAPTPELAAALDGVVPLPPGRLPGSGMLRLGKLQADPDRLPAALRLARRPATRALVAAADVLVAVDQAAVPAIWWAARRNRRAAAINGVPAAVARYGR